MIEPLLKFQKGTKFITEIIESTVDTTIKFELSQEKNELHKALRILASVNRLLHNCHYPKQTRALKTKSINQKTKNILHHQKAEEVRRH